jgi:choline dehydrogenase
MQRRFLHALAVAPALAWTQPRFGYVPGNDYGIPQNASYDYVIVGGGKHSGQYDTTRPF